MRFGHKIKVIYYYPGLVPLFLFLHFFPFFLTTECSKLTGVWISNPYSHQNEGVLSSDIIIFIHVTYIQTTFISKTGGANVGIIFYNTDRTRVKQNYLNSIQSCHYQETKIILLKSREPLKIIAMRFPMLAQRWDSDRTRQLRRLLSNIKLPSVKANSKLLANRWQTISPRNTFHTKHQN